MCGIWAIFGSDNDLQVHFQNAFKIAHRGPDSFCLKNINHFKNCLLGFHQLAIMDDVLGMQPMKIKDFPHVVMIYNGEIYNFEKLRDQYNFNFTSNCDGEVLIHLYVYGGIDFMAKMLDGVFAFCLLDTQTNKVFIGRDTIGIRPMFRLYQEEDGILAICSEGKGLVGLDAALKGFADVNPFPPGHYEEHDLLKNGKAAFVERRRFHSIEKIPRWALETPVSATSGDEHYTNIRLLLTEAVRKRFMANRRIGCLLSGGLDSSLITALAATLVKEQGVKYRLQTFSIGMTGSPDLAAARKVASHIGSEHYEISFTAEEGFQAIEDVIYSLETYDVITIRSSIANYLLTKYVKENTDTVVVYSGEGADELCQGYIQFRMAPSPEDAHEESYRLMNDLHFYDVARCDRVSAAHGLEVRVPFLDHHLVSYVLSIPPELRAPRNGIEKYNIRKAFDGTGLLPDDILWRPKEGFSDGVSPTEKSWNTVLKECIEKKVNDNMMKEAPKLYPINTPKTKEAFYYRHIFEGFFPNCSSWTPYQWTPKWVNISDPSARSMAHYNNSVIHQNKYADA